MKPARLFNIFLTVYVPYMLIKLLQHFSELSKKNGLSKYPSGFLKYQCWKPFLIPSKECLFKNHHGLTAQNKISSCGRFSCTLWQSTAGSHLPCVLHSMTLAETGASTGQNVIWCKAQQWIFNPSDPSLSLTASPPLPKKKVQRRHK